MVFIMFDSFTGYLFNMIDIKFLPLNQNVITGCHWIQTRSLLIKKGPIRNTNLIVDKLQKRLLTLILFYKQHIKKRLSSWIIAYKKE